MNIADQEGLDWSVIKSVTAHDKISPVMNEIEAMRESVCTRGAVEDGVVGGPFVKQIDLATCF